MTNQSLEVCKKVKRWFHVENECFHWRQGGLGTGEIRVNLGNELNFCSSPSKDSGQLAANDSDRLDHGVMVQVKDSQNTGSWKMKEEVREYR